MKLFTNSIVVGALFFAFPLSLCLLSLQVTLDDGEEKVYELTAAQADEGEGTKNLKLRNVKGQGGVRFSFCTSNEKARSMFDLKAWQ